MSIEKAEFWKGVIESLLEGDIDEPMVKFDRRPFITGLARMKQFGVTKHKYDPKTKTLYGYNDNGLAAAIPVRTPTLPGHDRFPKPDKSWRRLLDEPVAGNKALIGGALLRAVAKRADELGDCRVMVTNHRGTLWLSIFGGPSDRPDPHEGYNTGRRFDRAEPGSAVVSPGYIDIALHGDDVGEVFVAFTKNAARDGWYDLVLMRQNGERWAIGPLGVEGPSLEAAGGEEA